jgi:hypothetical protein
MSIKATLNNKMSILSSSAPQKVAASIDAVVKNTSKIVANTTTITSSLQGAPVQLKNNVVGQNYIHSLLDVVEIQPETGSTLVYNAETHKYEVKPYSGGLDGGDF